MAQRSWGIQGVARLDLALDGHNTDISSVKHIISIFTAMSLESYVEPVPYVKEERPLPFLPKDNIPTETDSGNYDGDSIYHDIDEPPYEGYTTLKDKAESDNHDYAGLQRTSTQSEEPEPDYLKLRPSTIRRSPEQRISRLTTPMGGTSDS